MKTIKKRKRRITVMPPPKAGKNNIVKVVIQLGELECEENETYFVPNFVRHIELTGINNIKFNANTVRELNAQFNMAIKQLNADYEGSA